MLLETESLSVSFRHSRKLTTDVTHRIDLSINAGEVVALVGESGSGKSVTAMEIAGLNPKNAESSGRVLFEGRDVLKMSAAQRRGLLEDDIGVIFQDPLSSLNPVYTIGTSLGMSMKRRKPGRKQRRARAIELLEQVNIPEPELAVDKYPHELSGGQRQRVMIAMAIDPEPKLLIADEPTTALDVTVQADVLDLIERLQKRLGMAMLLITHDMGVVANSADRLYVMQHGHVREHGRVEEVFAHPEHEYTKNLFGAVPTLDVAALTAGSSDARVLAESTVGPKDVEHSADEACRSALELRDIDYYYSESLKRADKKALDSVSFKVGFGETIGLVGESGSGKSTIGRIAVGLLQPSSGEMICGSHDGRPIVRSMVFQDPASSLDPRRTVAESIAAPLVWSKQGISRVDIHKRVRSLLDKVRLPSSFVDRLPHELSGGQRQRVGIARGLSIDPNLLVADEPTSALDVSVQAAVLDLFTELQKEYGFSCIFISHDLAVVEQVAANIVVLRKGKIEESGRTKEIIYNPGTEYTRRLIRSVPIPDPNAQRKRKLERVK
ncbi:ABC transporter ATP-binding protein [Brevibacterium sp. SMBL_HHYL_HB1]|uniref:dipeptide ABC transporter ATP-binding protein n=1 Tax=Brevibacterium sp. SMBL_HHYL_HB1 TaxID=2777556 RepID=UPI001BAA9ABB|nr:ABC transporter ATP-binding protein [Brevibacterium sp. SMBL_HHYL_HB1]QUL80666.1 ABC transporter ATP-binding protein [Brevibacterium sp. SMBL_HHYL_HB1]